MALERWHSISKSWVVVEVVVSKVKWLVISLVVLLQSVTGPRVLGGKGKKVGPKISGPKPARLMRDSKSGTYFHQLLLVRLLPGTF